MVQLFITSASEMWLDHITKVCLKPAQKLLEQRRENNISQQNDQALLMDNNKALVAAVETALEQVGGCQAEIQVFKSNTEEAQKTAQEAQRLLVNPITNLHRVQGQSQNHEEEGRVIMERVDEARRVFDEAVEEMDEDQERKHRESLNEST